MYTALSAPPPHGDGSGLGRYGPVPPAHCAGVYPSAALESWQTELPADWRAQVVEPVRFEVQQEHEILADRVDGLDAAQQPCYLAHRYVLTQLRCDDDERFYEVPVYIETLTAWRLHDGRWLHLRQTISDCERGVAQRRLGLSPARPREGGAEFPSLLVCP